jgi:hypothetical protein
MNIIKQIHWDAKRMVPPAVLAIIAIAYLVQASGFSDNTSQEAPMLYGTALLALSILVFGLTFIPGVQAIPKRSRTKHAEGPFPWLASFEIFAMIAGFLVMVFLFGFYVAIPLFLVLFLRGISHVGVPKLLVGAAVSYGFVWLVFAYFLHLNVFVGYLVGYV